MAVVVRSVAGVADQESPQVHPVGHRRLDVEIDLESGGRQVDRPGGDPVEVDASRHQHRASPSEPQPVLGSHPVRHPGQVRGQQDVHVTGGELGDRRDTEFPQHLNLVHVQRRLRDAQAEVVVGELRTTDVPPLAPPAFTVGDRLEQRRIARRQGGRRLGQFDAERMLGVVTLQGGDQLGVVGVVAVARARRHDGEPEVDPGQHVAEIVQVVGADNSRDRTRGRPTEPLQHAVVVRQLQQVVQPPAVPEPAAGQVVQHQRIGQARPGQAGRLAARVADPMELDLGGMVTAVVGAQQQVGSPAAVLDGVAGQQRRDQHLHSGGHGGQADLLLLRRGQVGEQAGVEDGTAEAGQQPRQHLGLERHATVEHLTNALIGRRRRRQPRMERVVRLDRAAAGGVGVEGEHQARARCRATMPPVRFFHCTSAQPAAAIRSASRRCAGQARIDSARYS